jgi:8-oxo-dGTP pyrophosphatase MutT (NUDIX family)
MQILPLERLALSFAPRPWDFAQARRAEIDAYFATLRRDKPALWNGRTLLMHEARIAGTTLEGEFLETDFASFIAWRDWGFPDLSIRSCFAHGALRAADGAYLLGVMGTQTANAGRVYFPGGSPDPADIVDGAVDFEVNVRREVAEETGLTESDYEVRPGWHAAVFGQRIALSKILQAHAPAEELRARIRAHIARDAAPELADIRIVRGPADVTADILPFTVAFLMRMWREGQPAGEG